MRAALSLIPLLVVGCAREHVPTRPPLPGAEAFSEELWTRLAPFEAGHRFTNRLALEHSPYLLQHAHNPIDWYPFGDEAFAQARRLGRPILLSIGYSSCHWCHVMEAEDFEDEEVATYLNSHYVSIKVDREERPDLDSVYLQAAQLLSGSAGWPETLWLTADRQPFYAGGYFVKARFLTVLAALHDELERDPNGAAARAREIAGQLPHDQPVAHDVPDATVLAAAARTFGKEFDAENGGFGRRPKFPRPSVLALLLRIARHAQDPAILAEVTTTLDHLAAGGIHDQLAGGFHRYATDERWRVPHYEKMLYDQALLADVYLEAWQATGRAEYAGVVRDILDWVAGELAAPDGGFYGATDADAAGREGSTFLWSPSQIEDPIVRAYYHVEGPDPAPLWVTPGAAPPPEVVRARPILVAARARRVQPAIDHKEITDWNALMISAYARAGLALGEPRYVELARRAARRLTSGAVRHDPDAPGYLDDYAFLITALLDLDEADRDPRWRAAAVALAEELERKYGDPAGGYYFTATGAEAALVREKPEGGQVIPSGNAAAAIALLRLYGLTGDERYRARADGVLRAFAAAMRAEPAALADMDVALEARLDRPKQIVIVVPSGQDPAPLVAVVTHRFLPNHTLQLGAEPVGDKRALAGLATAYVCVETECAAPTTDPAVLAAELAQVDRLEPLSQDPR